MRVTSATSPVIIDYSHPPGLTEFACTACGSEVLAPLDVDIFARTLGAFLDKHRGCVPRERRPRERA